MSSYELEEQDGSTANVEEATPEQLLEREDGPRFELIDGKLKERHMGALSSFVAGKVIRRLGQYAEQQELGSVFPTDCGYQIFPNKPNQVRYPDCSFIGKGRLPEDKIPGGHMRIPPDLAVEVVSPNDAAEEVEAKRLEF